MPVIRTYEALQSLNPTPPEIQLIADSLAGRPCILGDGTRPDTADPARTIRADVLRYLATGGSKKLPVDGRGVSLRGAYITGKLDLGFSMAKGATQLTNCHFVRRIYAIQTQFVSLDLDGSRLSGLVAEACTVTGHAQLNRITTRRTVSFNNAHIGGQLTMIGSDVRGTSLKTNGDASDNTTAREDAIGIHSATVEGGVFIRDSTIDGTVRLTNSTLGNFGAEGSTIRASNGIAVEATHVKVLGTVSFTQREVQKDSSDPSGTACAADVQGEILLTGARIDGSLDMRRAKLHSDHPYHQHALNGQRMTVALDMRWDKTTVTAGAVSLNGAHVGELADNPENWPLDPDQLMLVGFTYNRIKGKVSVSPARRAWLRAGSHYNGQFFPQPFTQYAKFLREVGHESEAQQVLTQREHLRLRHQRLDLRVPPDGTWSVAFHSFYRDLLRVGWWLMHMTFRYVAGYGHRPFRSIYALLVLVALTVAPAHWANVEGSMVPNSGPVLVSPGWIALATDTTNTQPAVDWTAQVPGKDYETFSAIAYGFDVVIPIIDFGQTDAWAPSTEREDWGKFLYWWRWVMTAAGWVATALGAAAVTSVIRRE